MPLATTWMNLEIFVLRKVRQRKTNIISLLCGILKKIIQMNLFTKQKQIQDVKHKLMVTKGERLVRGIH